MEKGLERLPEYVLGEQHSQECAARYGDLTKNKQGRSRVTAGEFYPEHEGRAAKYGRPDCREDDLAAVNLSLMQPAPEGAQRAGQDRRADDVEE